MMAPRGKGPGSGGRRHERATPPRTGPRARMKGVRAPRPTAGRGPPRADRRRPRRRGTRTTEDGPLVPAGDGQARERLHRRRGGRERGPPDDGDDVDVDGAADHDGRDELCQERDTGAHEDGGGGHGHAGPTGPAAQVGQRHPAVAGVGARAGRRRAPATTSRAGAPRTRAASTSPSAMAPVALSTTSRLAVRPSGVRATCAPRQPPKDSTSRNAGLTNGTSRRSGTGSTRAATTMPTLWPTAMATRNDPTSISPVAASTARATSVAPTAAPSTMRRVQKRRAAISTRRRTSSSWKTAVATANATACGPSRMPVRYSANAPMVEPPATITRVSPCRAARTEGSWRSRTVSESPTSPLVTAVTRMITPRQSDTTPSPRAPRAWAATTCSAKLAGRLGQLGQSGRDGRAGHGTALPGDRSGPHGDHRHGVLTRPSARRRRTPRRCGCRRSRRPAGRRPAAWSGRRTRSAPWRRRPGRSAHRSRRRRRRRRRPARQRAALAVGGRDDDRLRVDRLLGAVVHRHGEHRELAPGEDAGALTGLDTGDDLVDLQGDAVGVRDGRLERRLPGRDRRLGRLPGAADLGDDRGTRGRRRATSGGAGRRRGRRRGRRCGRGRARGRARRRGGRLAAVARRARSGAARDEEGDGDRPCPRPRPGADAARTRRLVSRRTRPGAGGAGRGHGLVELHQ